MCNRFSNRLTKELKKDLKRGCMPHTAYYSLQPAYAAPCCYCFTPPTSYFVMLRSLVVLMYHKHAVALLYVRSIYDNSWLCDDYYNSRTQIERRGRKIVTHSLVV